MSNKGDHDLTVEVGRRLDNIFGESDSPSVKSAQVNARRNMDVNSYPLRVVKANILSIDWEITDEAIAGLLKQLDLLKKAFGNDKVVQILIQMLISLGKYIKVRKGKANVHSMKVLKSVFSGLEQIVEGGLSDQAARMEILRTKMGEFHALQAQVTASMSRPRPKTTEHAAPDLPLSFSPDDLQQIADILATELKKLIRQEFSLLRKALLSARP